MSLPILKRNNNIKSKNIEKIIFQPQPGPHSVPSIYPNELEKKNTIGRIYVICFIIYEYFTRKEH